MNGKGYNIFSPKFTHSHHFFTDRSSPKFELKINFFRVGKNNVISHGINLTDKTKDGIIFEFKFAKFNLTQCSKKQWTLLKF